jgi:hypothetical protein
LKGFIIFVPLAGKFQPAPSAATIGPHAAQGLSIVSLPANWVRFSIHI